MVDLVSKGITTGRGTRGAYVHHDAVNGELRGRKGARLAAVTSGGAIPENGDYRVVAEPDDTFIGTVNEDWAIESMAGDIFLLGTHSWQIRQVEPGVVRVRDAGTRRPRCRSGWARRRPAPPSCRAEVSKLRTAVDAFLVAGDPDGARRWLMEAAGVDLDAATMVVDYLAVGRAALGAMPTQQQLVLERFFDETGGMQLVVHSPFGGRINRGLGLALRKKFCRTFNFELQAAASDDAIVLSLGPHHSFPLQEVPGYLQSATVDDTLQHAILDSPMFLARWRWNLNRSLMVLRFRGGRRNPPPIQRMESDDLMAAVFPQAAACQENVTGPIEIPDHVLVRQTIGDTLHEALDVDGVRELLERMESGAVTVHFADTTEPSVLAHEILTARPVRVPRRRGAAEPPHQRGHPPSRPRGRPGVDRRARPDAIVQVHAEITPEPTSADDLHDLLSSMVVAPRPRRMAGAVRRAGRPGTRRRARTGRRPALVHHRAHRRRHSRVRRRRGRDRVRPPGSPRDRRDHERRRARRAPPPSPRAASRAGLAYLEQSGFVLQGSYTAHADGTEWVSRRLLARMHSYSRRSRRGGVEPATAQDFVRFLLRWQHVAPGTQLTGEAGLLTVVEQLQGFDAAAVAWEPDAPRVAVAPLRPRLARPPLPRRRGRLAPPHPTAARDADAPAVAPSKATPISVVARADLPWLLPAARVGTEPHGTGVGGTAEILEVLRERGACFADRARRQRPTACPKTSNARCGTASRGSGDVRRLRRDPGAGHPRQAHRRGPALLAPGAGGTAAGRGGRSLVARARGGCPPRSPVTDRDELAEAVAELLLHRWGVVFRDLVVHDSLRFPWRDLQWALRRLEDRGLVRGGRFVTGFSGEQYALPAAVEQLAQARRQPRTGERVTVNATDPLNLVGVVLPGSRVPAVRTRRVTYVDGLPGPVGAHGDPDEHRAECLKPRVSPCEHVARSPPRIPRLRRAARGLLRARLDRRAARRAADSRAGRRVPGRAGWPPTTCSARCPPARSW